MGVCGCQTVSWYASCEEEVDLTLLLSDQRVLGYLVRNFDYIPSLDAPSCRCKTCLATKAERAPFPHEAKSRAPKPGIRLHFDHKEVRAASRRGYHFRGWPALSGLCL